MIFITNADLDVHIPQRRLNQIIANNATILDTAESTAIRNVKDALYSKYDVDAIFSGTDKPAQVVRWVCVLVLYYIHERIPDAQVPERVVRNYDDVLATLEKIADGKWSIDLPSKADEDNKPKTKFRWGSKPRRSL